MRSRKRKTQTENDLQTAEVVKYVKALFKAARTKTNKKTRSNDPVRPRATDGVERSARRKRTTSRTGRVGMQIPENSVVGPSPTQAATLVSEQNRSYAARTASLP